MDARNPRRTEGLKKALLCLAVALCTSGCKIESFGPGLYRGGEVDAKLIPKLKEMGIKTIISMRTNPKQKIADQCEKEGMHYFHLPTGVFRTPGKKEFDQFFAIVDDPKQRPVYICCQTDRDRTGLYASVYRALHENVSYEELMNDMKRHHSLGIWFWKYKHVIHDYVQRRQETQKTNAASEQQDGSR